MPDVQFFGSAQVMVIAIFGMFEQHDCVVLTPSFITTVHILSVAVAVLCSQILLFVQYNGTVEIFYYNLSHVRDYNV